MHRGLAADSQQHQVCIHDCLQINSNAKYAFITACTLTATSSVQPRCTVRLTSRHLDAVLPQVSNDSVLRWTLCTQCLERHMADTANQTFRLKTCWHACSHALSTAINAKHLKTNAWSHLPLIEQNTQCWQPTSTAMRSIWGSTAARKGPQNWL